MPDLSELGDDPSRTTAIVQGQIVRAVHAALHAAGEPAPEFEYLTLSIGSDGGTFVRLSTSERGPRGPSDLGPGDRLYALLGDQSGVYERTIPRPELVLHRALRFDGTVDVLAESPFL